jgi:hypothetical protein
MANNFSAFVEFMADRIKIRPKACHCAFCNDEVIEFYDTDVVDEVRKVIDPDPGQFEFVNDWDDYKRSRRLWLSCADEVMCQLCEDGGCACPVIFALPCNVCAKPVCEFCLGERRRSVCSDCTRVLLGHRGLTVETMDFVDLKIIELIWIMLLVRRRWMSEGHCMGMLPRLFWTRTFAKWLV